MSTARDQAYGLRLMHVRNGLPPATNEDRPRRRAIAVTGGKGGVGKSFVALNLSITYANAGARVLTLDGDMGMADLNLLLGIAPERSVLDVLHGGRIEDSLVRAHGIHVLPALNGSHRLANLEEQARERILDDLDRLGERFDTLVIDTAAGIGATPMGLAAAASDVVVVATPEPLSLADAYACLKVLATRHGLRRALVLPNEVRSSEEGDEVFHHLRTLVDRFLGIELRPLPGIPLDPMVPRAGGAGVPMVLYSPDSPASRALRNVARRIDAMAAVPAGAERFQKFLRAAGGCP